LVQHRNLRILHGKGNGILRQLIRDYLGTLNVVKSFRDEHVDMGGSGITVVEMDY
jgi:DNA mismatch repair protein MutS2